MASLGQELKRERELRSISLHDIAEQTKIGVRHLQALEDDRLDLLPGKFLTKAIIRSYAKALGMDEDRIMNMFHEEALSQEWDTRLSEKARLPIISRKPTVRRRVRLVPVLLVGAALLAVLAGLYIFVIAPARPAAPPRGRGQKPAEPAAAAQPLEFPELPPVVGGGRIAPSDALKLEFEFQAATWMHVTADGILVLEGIRKAGTRETFEARTEVILQTGNAGGFRLRINGRPVRPLGPSGKVLTDVRIRHDNLDQFLVSGK